MGLEGADTQELWALEGNIGGIAGEIEQMGMQIRNRIYSFEWNGVEADRLRSAWESVGSARLIALVAELRNRAQLIHFEAIQQDEASDDDPAGVMPLGDGNSGMAVDMGVLLAGGVAAGIAGGNGEGGGGDLPGFLSGIDETVSNDLEYATAGLEGVTGGITAGILSGHLNWSVATDGQVLGDLSFAGKALDAAGAVAGVAGGVFAGWSYYQNDTTDSTGVRAAKSVVDGSVSAAAGMAAGAAGGEIGADAGAAIGTVLIPIPVVGTVVGGIVGGLVGGVIGGWVGSQGGAMVASGLISGASAVGNDLGNAIGDVGGWLGI